jgi:hypothetical protein
MADILDTFSRQLNIESGNRQFNKDGSVVTSPKGAIGAAQVMPTSGPEGAQFAGVPWDPVRFKTDAAYNRLVGAGYKSKMLGKFDADDRAATAAYNGGPGRIAGLQRQYGSDWEAHLTGETKDYLTSALGVVSNPTPGRDESQPVATSTTPQSQAQPSNPEIDKAKADVAQGNSQMTDILGAANAAIQTVQAQRVTDLSKMVSAKDAVLTDIDSNTRELADRVKPVFAKRAAIAHRLTELDTMNPFKRALLGVVDRNYNRKDLTQLDSDLAGEAKAAGEEYQTNTAMQNTLAQVIQGHYEGQAALTNLHLDNINTDLTLADKGLAQIHQRFTDSIQGVQADAEVIRAKAALRSDTLSQMTLPQLNTGVSQARQSGGFATINGVSVSEAELHERAQQLEGQDLALKGQRIGVQSGEISLQRNQEERLISHMSSADIKSAIDAGGIFKGVQLDQGQLTQAYSNSLQRNDLMAGATGEQAAAQSYAGTVDAFNGGMQDTMRRVSGVVGSRLPPAMQSSFMSMVHQINQYSSAIRSAPTPEAANKLRSTFLPRVQEMTGQIQAQIDTTVKGMTRNPDAQNVLRSWMTGATPTAEQSTRGLIALVSGGALPPGVRLSGPAADAMNATRAAVAGVYAKYAPGQKAGTPQEQMAQLMSGAGAGGKPNAAQLSQELGQAVSKAVASTWVNSNLNQLTDSLPQMAAADKHAAGNINPQDYRAARAGADSQGVAALATKLGWSEADTESVFGPNGSGQNGFDKKTGGKGSVTYSQARQQLAGLQTQMFLRNLDSSPSASYTFRPSAALVDYMQSSAFQSRVGAYNRNVGHTGLGEMLADSVSTGSLGQVAMGYANQMRDAAGANDLADQDIVRQKIQGYNGSPLKRAGIIIGSVPGMSSQDKATLLKAVSQGIRPDGPESITQADPIMARAETRSDIGKIDSVILHGKFQDPGLEKLRQLAAKHWVAYSASSDSVVKQLTNSILGGF